MRYFVSIVWIVGFIPYEPTTQPVFVLYPIIAQYQIKNGCDIKSKTRHFYIFYIIMIIIIVTVTMFFITKELIVGNIAYGIKSIKIGFINTDISIT